jgi:hypothetical protein
MKDENKLKKSFKYGVELEMGIPYDYSIADFQMEVSELGCTHSNDASISIEGEAIEVQTPPRGYNATLRILSRLDKVLSKYEATTNQSCGVHLHASNKRFYSRKHLLQIMYAWLSIEDVMFATQPSSRLHSQYCERLLKRYVGSRYDYIQKLPTKKEDIMERATSLNRYCSLNINSLAVADENHDCEHGHGTLEFRLFAGTVNIKNLQAYLEFARAFYNYCLTSYNKTELNELFELSISQEKINKTWELLKLSNKTRALFNRRINKNVFQALKAQQEGAVKYTKEYKDKLQIARVKFDQAQDGYRVISNEVEHIRGLF